eukprot:31510-Pelagococcus_subviridis.AAC.17
MDARDVSHCPGYTTSAIGEEAISRSSTATATRYDPARGTTPLSSARPPPTSIASNVNSPLPPLPRATAVAFSPFHAAAFPWRSRAETWHVISSPAIATVTPCVAARAPAASPADVSVASEAHDVQRHPGQRLAGVRGDDGHGVNSRDRRRELEPRDAVGGDGRLDRDAARSLRASFEREQRLVRVDDVPERVSHEDVQDSRLARAPRARDRGRVVLRHRRHGLSGFDLDQNFPRLRPVELRGLHLERYPARPRHRGREPHVVLPVAVVRDDARLAKVRLGVPDRRGDVRGELGAAVTYAAAASFPGDELERVLRPARGGVDVLRRD